MEDNQTLTISVQSQDKKEAQYAGRYFLWTPRKAANKGLKWFAGAIIFAIATLPIPIVHFVSTPAGLILGPLIGFIIYRFFKGQEEIRLSQVSCPSCQKKIDLPQNLQLWPVREKCPNCQQELTAMIKN
ncbi:MAG: hypothetical protein ACOH5I_13335 [Oligoflexus sp.]